MSFIIRKRKAGKGDMPFLRQVYGSTRWEELDRAGWSPEEKNNFLDMQFKFQDLHYRKTYPDTEFLIIEVDGKAAGRLYIDRRKTEIRVVDIALLPRYRGKGIGYTLMSEILEEGRKSGRHVAIHVEHENPAMSLYKRLGFKNIDDTGVYHLMEWRAPKEEPVAAM